MALYREEQRFTQWWLWLVTLIPAILVWWLTFQGFFLPPSSKTPLWELLILWLLVGMGLPYLIYSCRLVLEVRPDGFWYRFYPFHWRWHPIPKEKIQAVSPVTYHPIRDYGGWGIRYGPKGKAYNVSGNKGVKVVLINGKAILFGSQTPEKLVQAFQGIGVQVVTPETLR